MGRHEALLALHGILLICAFLVVYPLGILAKRVQKDVPLPSHWKFQLTGSVLVIVGASLGLAASNSISTTHQYIGIALFGSVILQTLSGLANRIGLVLHARRRWTPILHVIFGNTVLLTGYGNLLLGVHEKQPDVREKSAVWVIVVVEALGILALGFTYSWNKSGREANSNLTKLEGNLEAAQDDFVFKIDDDDDDDDDDEGIEDKISNADSEVTVIAMHYPAEKHGR